MARTLAKVFPRQSESSLIFSSMEAEVDEAGVGVFIEGSPVLAATVVALSG